MPIRGRTRLTEDHESNRRLAVFDVEGILIPKRQFILLQATQRLKLGNLFLIFLQGFLYELGIYPLAQAFRGIYRVFKGVSQNELSQTFKLVPIIPGVQPVFQKLKELGYHIALISSGIPDFLVNELASQLGADYAYGLELEFLNGIFTGKIKGDVIKENGKALIFEILLKENHFTKQNCLAIVDDRNNLPLFPLCEKIIGYNPDTIIAARCDYAIKGELQDIIPFFDPTVKTLTMPYTPNDIIREIIHMGSFLIPLISQWYQINPYTFALLIFITTVLFTISELMRRIGTTFPPFTNLTNLAAQGDEKWGFAFSPIFFALGICLSLILFPQQIGFAAITILTLGDGTAKIIGKLLGTTHFPYNKAKKIEGTAAGIIVATIGSLLFVPPHKALIVSTVCMIVESFPSPINDNLVIPLIAGFLLIVIP
jgi:HAD superfamily phosphoserine phosphatase-like hydrolase